MIVAGKGTGTREWMVPVELVIAGSGPCPSPTAINQTDAMP